MWFELYPKKSDLQGIDFCFFCCNFGSPINSKSLCRVSIRYHRHVFPCLHKSEYKNMHLLLQQSMNSWMWSVFVRDSCSLMCLFVIMTSNKLSQYIWHIDMINMTQCAFCSAHRRSVLVISSQICITANSMCFCALENTLMNEFNSNFCQDCN